MHFTLATMASMVSMATLGTQVLAQQNHNIFGEPLSMGIARARVSPQDAQARLDAAKALAPPGTIPVLNDSGEISLLPDTRGKSCGTKGKGNCNNDQECQDQGGSIFKDAAARAECKADGFDKTSADAAAEQINKQLGLGANPPAA